MKRRSPLLVVALVGASAAAAASAERERQAAGQEARAELRMQDGTPIGQVTFRQHPNGVLVTAELSGAPPGVRAFHIHEQGRCEGDFESAGAHLNPAGGRHGLGSPGGMHAGDLPNLHIPASGALEAELFAPQLTLGEGKGSLLDADGSTVVLHAAPDDYRSDPAGAAGARIACGVIRR
jgi:Cu-Zn family superoxide dismutase